MTVPRLQKPAPAQSAGAVEALRRMRIIPPDVDGPAPRQARAGTVRSGNGAPAPAKSRALPDPRRTLARASPATPSLAPAGIPAAKNELTLAQAR